MKTFTILEPASQKLIDNFVRHEAGIKPDFIDFIHPQEDYFSISKKNPIFAVADGVTLEYGAFGKYPNPSGAGEVARIFCEEFIKRADKIYNKFGHEDILKLFSAANSAVGDYNRKNGLTKETTNYWDKDLFAATAAFAVLINKTVFWGSICDSYLLHYSADGSRIFKSPGCWPSYKFLPQNWEEIGLDERKKIVRKTYRNGIGKNGELIGYGVVTGEDDAVRYLNCGSFKVEAGDIVALITDGFEEYMNLPEFIDIFKSWPYDIESEIKKFTSARENEDFEKFGHERTLIMIKL